jgi:hypothetical protein
VVDLIGDTPLTPASFTASCGVVRFATKSLICLKICSQGQSPGGLGLPTEERDRGPIKVTDKRLFTDDGDLREEYRDSIRPSDEPVKKEPAEAQPGREASAPAESREAPAGKQQPDPPQGRAKTGQRQASEIEHPETPFAKFLDSLIVNAYVAMGMIRHPYQEEVQVDLQAARQMIDIVTMLEEKTRGNLTPEESEYLDAHLGDLKLAFVRRSQSI